MKAAAPASQDWQPRWRQLVKGLVRVQSQRGEEQLLDALAAPNEPRMLAFVNAHAMNSAAISREFFDAIMSADLVLRDGIGMAILLRLLNQSVPSVYGPTADENPFRPAVPA